MTCAKKKRFFAKDRFITLEIFDYQQKFFQCCLGIKHSSFSKRNSIIPNNSNEGKGRVIDGEELEDKN